MPPSSASPPPRLARLTPWPQALAGALPAGLATEDCPDPALALGREDLDALVLEAGRAPELAELLARARGRGPLVLALGPLEDLGPALAAGADAVARPDDPLAWHLARLVERTRRRRALHRLRGTLGAAMARAELLADTAGSDGPVAERAAALLDLTLELREQLDRWPRLSI